MTEEITICGKRIEMDRSSGAGQCWRVIDRENIPENVVEEIAAEIIDGDNDTCECYVASNGVCYRW